MATKEAIFPKGGAPPAAPYSPGLRVGHLLFVSGQVPIDPLTRNVERSDIKAATRIALANVVRVLESAGATFADVVKVTIFLKDMGDFAAVNEVYETVLGTVRPARSAVQVSGLPLDSPIEIEAIAYLDDE